ncbi:MAG: histidine kinase, partial [Verrucomicrobiota bacterium]
MQIGGWLGFAIVVLPLKVVFFGSAGMAVLATLYREPLGFVLSLGLRWVYRCLQASGEIPAWQLGCWATAVSAGAGAIEWGAAEILNLSTNMKVPHALGAFGLFWFRSLIYLTWSVLYFWIRGQIAAREHALKLMQIKAAAQESELLMLRAQVNPHFLFNALNTVMACRDDPVA